MRKSSRRADLKQESLGRILDAAARRLREEGLDHTAIVPVMRDAGLTHGTFYSHFTDKDDMAEAAFTHAMTVGRPQWITPVARESWRRRVIRLARTYLTPAHRDDLGTACGFAALSSDAARAPDSFRAIYERELRTSLAAICAGEDVDPAHMDDAIALMTVCVGGMALARAVHDPEFSAHILRVAQNAASKIVAEQSD